MAGPTFGASLGSQMPDEILVDTDVLIKAVSYRLANSTLAFLAERGLHPKVLGAARFMLATHVAKARRVADVAAAAAELAAVTPKLEDIEPTPEESTLAADIEALAATSGLPVHGGESQLLAMLMMRSTRRLLTGDKRAIEAISKMLSPLPPHRIACFEQLLGSLIEVLGPNVVRSAVCAEPAVDKALASACCCASAPGTDPRPGLESYIEDLRKKASFLLSSGCRLPC